MASAVAALAFSSRGTRMALWTLRNASQVSDGELAAMIRLIGYEIGQGMEGSERGELEPQGPRVYRVTRGGETREIPLTDEKAEIMRRDKRYQVQ